MPNIQRKAIEGDEVLRNPRATEDDVEGHGFKAAQAVEADEVLRNPRATEDDVEGHGFKAAQAVEADEVLRNPRATEDDVEGHGFKAAQAVEAEGHNPRRRATEDDDVEGHNIGALNPIMARDLARAHERDIQREVSRNSLIADAKRAQRKR
jgi:hypothetical protein